MKIKPGLTITSLSGKSNGVTIKESGYGLTMQTKARPRTATSPSITHSKSSINNISAAWRNLTQSQRNGWITFAPNYPYPDQFGNLRILSGFNLFVKCNYWLQAFGQPILTTPVAPVNDFVNTALECTIYTPANLMYVVTVGGSSYPIFYAVSASPVRPESVQHKPNQLKTLLLFQNLGGSPCLFAPEYTQAFGTVWLNSAGKFIYVDLKVIDHTSGFITNHLQGNVLIQH